jgi:hypothetical protein
VARSPKRRPRRRLGGDFAAALGVPASHSPGGSSHEYILRRELDRRVALMASLLEELGPAILSELLNVGSRPSPRAKSHRDHLHEFNVLFFSFMGAATRSGAISDP